jgi:hypothetical protein
VPVCLQVLWLQAHPTTYKGYGEVIDLDQKKLVGNPIVRDMRIDNETQVRAGDMNAL